MLNDVLADELIGVVRRVLLVNTQPPGGLPKYYEENVIGGPGAFLLQVENFDTFAEAMTRKLVTEIAGLPASPSAALQ